MGVAQFNPEKERSSEALIIYFLFKEIREDPE